MNLDVFVYGTLLVPKVVKALTGQDFRETKAILPHHQRFKIHQPGREARGPAIIQQQHAFVQGKVLHDVDPSSMKIFDLFELAASGYERVTVVVRRKVDDSQLAVQTYRATPALEDYLWGDWSLKDFKQNYKKEYVTVRIANLKKKWARAGEI